MSLRPFGVLDRYVVKQWCATFVLSAVGVPAVAVLIDLSERFNRLADRHLSVSQILIGQMYLFPSKMAILVPAAVLFATVFTLNGMGRHSELTAVLASGVSFYRLIAPMILLAVLAVPFDFELQELAGPATTRQKELQHENLAGDWSPMRPDFAYASKSGWTWAIKAMTQQPGAASGLVGEGPRDTVGRRWAVASDSAVWNPSRRAWDLRHGAAYFVSDSSVLASFGFKGLRVRSFTEQPRELMTENKRAEEMTTAELRGYINRLRASGAQAGALDVELPLKYAVPFACLVVALFGAPLAITNARAGAAIGLAIALGTTLVYLTGTQIMKAVGAKGFMEPHLAAWAMNIAFLAVGIVLLFRVRS